MKQRLKQITWLAFVLAAISCGVVSTPAEVLAQEPAAPATLGDDPELGDGTLSSDPSEAIGGGELVRGTYYNSPLKKIGEDLFFGTWAVGAIASIAYLGGVLPVQALFGSAKLQPVMLWLLLPVAGPFLAQQLEDSVHSKLFWRVVLIGDSALQATGIVIGLIGMALSGRRKLEPQSSSRGIDWNVSFAGPGIAGITLSVRTL